jgi:hypothetical protein
MCLFGLVLFLTGSTIVISLIPIYLPTRDLSESLGTISIPQTIVIRLSSNNALLLGTILDASTQTMLQNQVSTYLHFISIKFLVKCRCKQLWRRILPLLFLQLFVFLVLLAQDSHKYE